MGLNVAAISADQIEVEREGIWRLVSSTIDEDLTAVEFLVRYWESAGGEPEFHKRLQRNQKLASGKTNDAASYRIMAQRRALVQMCLAGWRTVQLERTGDIEEPYKRVGIIKEASIEFETGVWVEYSKGSAMRVIESAWRNVYSELEVAAHDDRAYREYLEEQAKNSESSPVGSSSTLVSSNDASANA